MCVLFWGAGFMYEVMVIGPMGLVGNLRGIGVGILQGERVGRSGVVPGPLGFFPYKKRQIVQAHLQ